MTHYSAKPPAPRLDAIDAARGCALLGMFVFHVTWDLAYFHFIPAGAPFSPAMMGFGHIVAIAFLALAGASLALAARDGLNWRAFSRRLGIIAAAAGAITLGTLYAMPGEFIFFGILHCIAAASLISLAFLRGPPWVALIAAGLMALAPLFVALPVLDNIPGWSLGLSARRPLTNDWRPILPWAGAALAGLGLTRMVLARGIPAALAKWRAGNAAARALAWGGRRSLPIYLVHQPVFLGLMYLAALGFQPGGVPQASEDARFQESCVAACVPSGAAAPVCEALCGCVGQGVHATGLWRAMMDDRLTTVQRKAVDDLTRTCAARR